MLVHIHRGICARLRRQTCPTFCSPGRDLTDVFHRYCSLLIRRALDNLLMGAEEAVKKGTTQALSQQQPGGGGGGGYGAMDLGGGVGGAGSGGFLVTRSLPLCSSYYSCVHSYT